MTLPHAQAQPRPTAIDLFAGAGGLSLGFEQAGFDVLCAVEYDPIHAATHRFNFPRTEVICADASTLSAETLIDAAARGWVAHGRSGRWSQELDVLIGGPPCQGFSFGGKRRVDDARNELIFTFARLVRELRPRYFVMENVQGLSSFVADESGTLLTDKLRAVLRRAGYRVQDPAVLNAGAFGVPQDRRRLFLVGARSDQPLPLAPSPTTRGRSRRPNAPLPTGTNHVDVPQVASVQDALAGLPNADEFEALLERDLVVLGLKEVERLDSASAYASTLREVLDDPTDLSYPRLWDRSSLTSSYRTTHSSDVTRRFEAIPPGGVDAVSRFVRLHPEGVAPTLRAGTHYERGSFNAPRPIHPSEPRVITVREAARLHSYPDWFRLHWTKWHGFRQVGNSVPPRVGRAVGVSIAEALAARPGKPTIAHALGEESLLYLENRDAARQFGADESLMPRNALRTRVTQTDDAMPLIS